MIMKEPKYRFGDIVVIFSDSMYEFKIIEWLENKKRIDVCNIKPSQIVLKLN